MIKKLILFLLLVCFNSLVAQEFFVDYQKIEGKLTSQDLVKEDFGRYDGYKMPLNKGERAYFIVYAEEFSPSLIVVTPNDEKFQQVSARGEDFVTLGFKVPQSGEWVLYVVGDKNAQGNYMLQYAFADSASLFLNENVEVCVGLNYLLAHSTAYFLFPQTVPSNKPLFKFADAVDAFINGDDASYNSVFYQGDNNKEAQAVYDSLIERIGKCVPKNWEKQKGTDTVNGSGVENYIKWSEPVKNNPRVVKVALTDFSNEDSGAEYINKYSVDLVIMRY